MGVVIHRVTTLDLKLEPYAWPFTNERRAEIEAHFADRQRAKPRIWNGRVLLARKPSFAGERFTASYFETDFASFLAWRDWGFPDKGILNGFGMGALRSADGAFILGEMAAHTANAGRIYFPAGTPEPADLDGDRFDVAASVVREIEEETGLTPADYRAEPHWNCVVSDTSVAMIRILQMAASGEAVKARIEANLARQEHPELAAVHLVRAMSDLTANMQRSVTAFITQQLASV